MDILKTSLDLEINEIAKGIHDNAIKKEFWTDSDDAYSVIMEQERCSLALATRSAFMMKKLMLIVTELAEACEADRIGRNADLIAFNNRVKEVMESMKGASEEEKHEAYAKIYKAMVKDTLGAEMAGACIRIFDFCQGYGIDIAAHIVAEYNYNLTRPVKHGKKY